MANETFFCMHCGATIPAQAAYCPACGKPQGAVAPLSPVAPVRTLPVTAGAAGSAVALATVLALVGAGLAAAAFLLPEFTGTNGYTIVDLKSGLPSGPAIWSFIEMLGYLVFLVIVAVLIASGRPNARAMGGILVGFGISELISWGATLGYGIAASTTDLSPGPVGPGLLAACAAGVVLVIGGVVLLASAHHESQLARP